MKKITIPVSGGASRVATALGFVLLSQAKDSIHNPLDSALRVHLLSPATVLSVSVRSVTHGHPDGTAQDHTSGVCAVMPEPYLLRDELTAPDNRQRRSKPFGRRKRGIDGLSQFVDINTRRHCADSRVPCRPGRRVRPCAPRHGRRREVRLRLARR